MPEPIWDYIIVGSGAGGAPLAARLALQGRRVLVLEAGGAAYPPTAQIPAFHGAASEDAEIAWEYFVKHYSDEALQQQDSKYDSEKKGIFYPRAAALGGCTIHNAMITIAGPPSGWDEVARLTGDDSWRGDAMRRYFQRLDRCAYLPRPDDDRDPARHGFDGWLHSSWRDVKMGVDDFELVKVMLGALKEAGLAGLIDVPKFALDLLHGRGRAHLDPNDAAMQQQSPEGVRLVPMAVSNGARCGPREFLLATQKELAARGQGDRLTIQTDVLVTKILLKQEDGKLPRAVGVEVRRGARAYRAHPEPSTAPGTVEAIACECEVILCGGAFNSPQLLMLSGIGPKDDLEKLGIKPIVDRPGVGANLRDRLEVAVVTEMNHNFALLESAAFGDPSVKNDPALDEWLTSKTGLYASNGVILAIQKRSRPDLPEPDLFIFGMPGDFRGYERGYSKKFAKKDRFTWAILKAHTSSRGTVRLISADPLDRPDINFMYFNDGKYFDDEDMRAVVEGVKFVRRINDKAALVVKQELWPSSDVQDDAAIKQFIAREAWGHHACGTCKMGKADDAAAVVDSRFRVHGVLGLRVVDASIFPKIPGMFIVSHIYMISEKAADVIAEDAQGGADNPIYPHKLRELETKALVNRRALAEVTGDTDPLQDSVGLALSGGGVRSATFCLGVVQALAKKKLLHTVDYLSTVSGGGYVGSFLGRFFVRYTPGPHSKAELGNAADAPKEIERQLADPKSPQIDWMRTHANYISPNGAGDATSNLGIFLRSILTLHFVLGTFLLTHFLILNLVRFWLVPLLGTFLPQGFTLPSPTDLPLGYMIQHGLPMSSLVAEGEVFWSPWFMLVEVMLLTLVIPVMLAYWLASQDRAYSYQPTALIVCFLLAGVLLIAGLSALGEVALQPLFAVATLLCSFLAVELAWRHAARRLKAANVGGLGVERMSLPRSIMTNWLGRAMFGTLVAFGFALVDTFGHWLYELSRSSHAAAGMVTQLAAVLAALMPFLHWLLRTTTLKKHADAASSGLMDKLKSIFLPWVLALSTLLLWATLLSFVAHWASDDGASLGICLAATGLTLLLSTVLRYAVHFVNRSSLQPYYAARLGRTYLGATNPARHAAEGGMNVTEDVSGDDVWLRNYDPPAAGGPIHLINTTVNQTTDEFSGRGNRGRPGEIVAVTKFGISIGIDAHALWDDVVWRKLTPIAIPSGDAHPFAKPTTNTEELTLKYWMAISGAAISSARGTATNVGAALLMGLANMRTGYWWRSGAELGQRPGPRRLFPLLMKPIDWVREWFLPQFLIIYELMGRYAGPWAPYWYLSDGGFFENLAVYELLRRRVRTIICCDAGQDGHYVFEDLGNLIRKARIDFQADIRFLTKKEIEDDKTIPAEVAKHLGTIEDLAPPKGQKFSRVHAALARIYYDGSDEPGSVLLYIKTSLTGNESPDVLNYKAMHPAFPHESTADQFFDEPQWESYRALGEEAALGVLQVDEAGKLWLAKSVSALE